MEDSVYPWGNPKLLLLQGNLGRADAKELNSTRKAFSQATSFLLWFGMIACDEILDKHVTPITPVRLTPLLYAWEVQPKVNASRMVSVQCQPSLSTLASQYTCEKLSFKSQSLRMSVIQCILIKFILVGKPILIVGRTIPWAGIRYCRKWRRQAEGEHSLLSASCLWMCSARLLRALAAATFPPCWTIPDCEPK